MVEPFHMAGSTIPPAIEIGGEPNAVVCQCASKPCEVTLAFSGRMLPPKLGVLQGDRIDASSCLPAKSRLNAPVPRRLIVAWNDTLLAAAATGALARISDAPLQSHSRPADSAQGRHGVSVPSTVIWSSDLRPVRLVVESAMKLSFTERAAGKDAAQSRFGREDKDALHVDLGVIYCCVKQAALAFLRRDARGHAETVG